MIDIDEMMNKIRSTIRRNQVLLGHNLKALKIAMQEYYDLRTRYFKEVNSKDFIYASVYQSRMDKIRVVMRDLQKTRKALLHEVKIREGYLDFHKKQKEQA